jgi:hypothetical protein
MSNTFGRVVFTDDDWQQIREYTRLCPTEVACMGYCSLDKSDVIVNDIFLVPQVVSGSSVEFVEAGFPWAVRKALAEDRLDELRFCWHSHVNFPSMFSSTDKEMVRKVHNSGPIPWFVSVVLNKRDDTHAQIDYFDLGPGVDEFCDHLTLELDVQVGEECEDNDEERIKELEEFCTLKPKPKPSSTSTLNGNNGASTEVPGESGCTPNDWKLHNLAKREGWEAYRDPEHYIHYWSPKDKKYKGCAPMPTNKDGSDKISVNETIIDANIIEELDLAPGEPLSETDKQAEEEIDRLVDEVMEREGVK